MTTTDRARTVPMPTLGENVTEGTVTRWLKQIGDTVEVDEPLLEVATDKVDTEIPSPVAGVLTAIIATEDDIVEIGAPLGLIAAAGDEAAAPPTAAPETAPAAVGAATSASHTSGPAPNGPPPSKSAAPIPRAHPEPAPATTYPDPTNRFAPTSPASRPPDLAPPSQARGADGADTETDRVQKLPRIRRTIAARMVESLQTAAQLTTVVEVDISRIARLRRENKSDFQQRTGHKLSYLPFLTKAAVDALRDNPVINSKLDPDVTQVTYYRSVHLGMAVDSEKGLMVPVIRHAQNLTIAGLAQTIAAVADRVRTGTIAADELAGGTFTITNTGSRGALFDTPIINQPQSAILGTGAVVERLKPLYDNAGNLTIAVVPTVYLALSYDHRIVDGADAARFLADVKRRLEAGYAPADLL